MNMVDIALFSQLTENEYLKTGGGIMDPFTIAMGKKDYAILLDTSDLSYAYAPLLLPHKKIIITNSGKPRGWRGRLCQTAQERMCGGAEGFADGDCHPP